jgi:response regulator RpfG family c-di-GMP phosphodiesterase
MPGRTPRETQGRKPLLSVANFTPRVTAILLIILFIFLGWTFFWLLYAERQALLEARRQTLADQVSLALSLCQSYQSQTPPRSPEAEAQRLALASLGSLRYGAMNAGYFYVVSNTGVLLEHPLRQDLVGTGLGGLKDQAGQPFIAGLLQAVRKSGRGFVTYRWQWTGRAASAAPLLACYAHLQPWDWIIVTEASTADIDEAISRELNQQLLILAVLSLLLALVLSTTLRRLVLSGVDRLIHVARRLQAGDLGARALATGADDLSALAVAVNQMADGIQRRDEQLRQAQRATMFALAKLAEARNHETGGHLLRVREYAVLLARTLAGEPVFDKLVDEQFLDDLYDATMLHDIGKVGIPDTILLKPDVLAEGEMAIMMSHTLLGANTIRAARQQMKVESSFLRLAEQIARSHHERWDGQGYVEQLRGEHIPAAARIFAVADVYDALTTERPYKPAYPHEQAVAVMREGRGTQFDPRVFDAFTQVSREFDAIRREYADEAVREH